MKDSVTSNPLDTAVVKLAVLKVSFGICALPEAELFRKLEEFYLEAYARGAGDAADELDRLRAEAERLRAICAAAYQMAGAYDAPVRFLDALALHAEYLAMTPDQIIDALLPVDVPDEIERLRAEVEKLRARIAEAEAILTYDQNCLQDVDGSYWDAGWDLRRKEWLSEAQTQPEKGRGRNL